MPGFYIASIISTLFTIGVWGVLFFRKAPKEIRWIMTALLILELPMSILTYYGVRVPLAEWYGDLVGHGTRLFVLLKSFEAPLTEELAKILPLIFFIPLIRKYKSRNGWFLGMALGLGFGLGEIWALTHLLTKSHPDLLTFPWYSFGGGIVERVMVSFLHGVFTGIAVHGILTGRFKAFIGILLAMSAHYFLNFPILLPALIPQIKQIFSYSVWVSLLGTYTGFYFLGALAIFWKHGLRETPTLLWVGQCTCKTCHKVFNPGLFVLNLLAWTGQRCPYCKKWHIYLWRPFCKKKKV